MGESTKGHEMTTQQPEALRLAELLELAPEDGVEPQTAEDAAAELRRQHARIAELEAKLEAIGAGGVSGQLMGCASIAASAGSEPVAHLWQHSETGRTRVVMPDMIVDADASWRLVGPLFLGSPPSPPEGMVMVPREPTEAMKAAAVKYANGSAVYKNVAADVLRIEESIYGEVYEAMIAALPPTTSAGSGRGE